MFGYLSINLAIGVLYGLLVTAFVGDPRYGVFVGLLTYASAVTTGCFLGNLRYKNDIIEGGITHLHQTLPDKTTITLKVCFSRDRDHRWPVVIESVRRL